MLCLSLIDMSRAGVEAAEAAVVEAVEVVVAVVAGVAAKVETLVGITSPPRERQGSQPTVKIPRQVISANVL